MRSRPVVLVFAVFGLVLGTCSGLWAMLPSPEPIHVVQALPAATSTEATEPGATTAPPPTADAAATTEWHTRVQQAVQTANENCVLEQVAVACEGDVCVSRMTKLRPNQYWLRRPITFFEMLAQQNGYTGIALPCMDAMAQAPSELNPNAWHVGGRRDDVDCHALVRAGSPATGPLVDGRRGPLPKETQRLGPELCNRAAAGLGTADAGSW